MTPHNHQIIHARELLTAAPKKIEWLIAGILPRRGTAILAGAPGVGKTWLAIDLCVEAARGGAWLGLYPTKKSRVLVVDEESTQDLTAKRLSLLCRERELEISSDMQLFFRILHGLVLTEHSSFGRFVAQVQQYRPDLIIIDSLIRTHRAEENSSTEMAAVFKQIRQLTTQYGCSIVITDHCRKPGEHTAAPAYTLRGSSEKHAFVDSLLILSERDSMRTLEHVKARHSMPVPPSDILIEETAAGVSVRGLKSSKANKQQQHRDNRAYLLKVVADRDEWVSRQELLAACKETDMTEKQIDRHLKHLVEMEWLVREDRSPADGGQGRASYYRPGPKFNEGPALFDTEEGG